jgi:hypothetical protein
VTPNVIDQFAALLAQTENPAKRAALLKRAEMLAMGVARDEAFEPPVINLGDYLDTPIPIPPSLVWPTTVVRGELTATLGRAGKGKTTMNLNRLIRWAAGKPLFDDFINKGGDVYLKPSHPLKVLVIENEGNAAMFHQKVGILLNNSGLLSPEDREAIRENVFIWGDGGYSGLKLDDPAMLSNVRAGCEKVDPDIVFIEPFRSLWSGEENSSTEMANMVDSLVAMATDYQCGVIVSHHERKSGAGDDGEKMSGGRGSTVLEGVVACMENFESVAGGEYRELTWSKSRYLQAPPPARLKYDVESNWYGFVPTDDIASGIIACIQENSEEPMSVKEIAEQLGETAVKLRPLLKDLVSKNRLKQIASTSNGEGSTGTRYRLPSGESDHGGLVL